MGLLLRKYALVFVSLVALSVLIVVYLSPYVSWGTRQSLLAATHSTRNLVKGKEILDRCLTQSKSVTKEDISLTDQTVKTQGYLLARDYTQQMTAAFHDFFMLSNMAFRLNLSTVEPFVQGSSLMGIPDITLNGQFWGLSKFYDVNNLKCALKTCSSLHQLVSFDTVLTKAPHTVVLVYFLTSNYNNFEQYFSGETIVELDANKSTYISQVNQTLHFLNTYVDYSLKLQQKQRPLFQYPRVILADARRFHPLLLSTLTEVLITSISGKRNAYDPSLFVFDKWQGTYIKNVPDFHMNAATCGARLIRHSKVVVEAARTFSQSLNQTQPVIGVHIRGEKLLLATKGEFSHCFHQLIDCLRKLTKSRKIPHESVNVFHDLGSYGTDSCTNNGRCVRGRSELLSRINSLSYPINSYDPTKFTSFPQSQAFASFVEREYLANVDILVTIGGGTFQLSIIERFLNFGHNKDKLYRIC